MDSLSTQFHKFCRSFCKVECTYISEDQLDHNTEQQSQGLVYQERLALKTIDCANRGAAALLSYGHFYLLLFVPTAHPKRVLVNKFQYPLTEFCHTY